MITRRTGVVAAWLAVVAFALIIVLRAHVLADLSAFLPRNPTPAQQLLVDQLRDGPAARLILIAVEGADAATRAKISIALAARLRPDRQFSAFNNGESIAEQGTREFLFKHRYLLSDQVEAARFSTAGLHQAIGESIGDLASPSGLMFKSLLPRDPTGELPHIIDQLATIASPQTRDGVWVAPDGSRAIAVAQTAAAGSDSDAQELAIKTIRTAFMLIQNEVTGGSQARLGLSGPGVFAVAARDKIERAALRLSLISGILVVTLLLTVYRSVTALGLGLLPVASGALVGIAAVALGFGVVHGITLGFGITLIGESVDYSIYFFIQSGREPAGITWRERWWPTVRLGMLTSLCGFASLLPSGFPGLQQLGLYSISGLLTAALVTRYVLPALKPESLSVRDVTPLGSVLARLVAAPRADMRRRWLAALALTVLALITLATRHTLWNRDLAALSPVSAAEQGFDAQLRADLGAADVRDLVVVSGTDLEATLQGAEQAGGALEPLIEAHVIGGFDTPSLYLPSVHTQESRRGSLPATAQLRDNLRQATNGLPVRFERLQPFLEDVESTRHGALLSMRDLKGTAMNTAFESMLLQQHGQFNALLPLHAPAAGAAIDLPRVAAALAASHVRGAQVLDLKGESDALYADYLREAVQLSIAGFLALTILLAVTLRRAQRVLRVLAPLVLAVLSVAATLSLCGVQLTLLHLVGMLLIVAVGSNYALFFDKLAHGSDVPASPLTLASLLIANASTVIGFGLLSFSQVPVLVTLGTTVAPGTLLALLFSASLASHRA
jgi:predicted exporter